VNGGEEILNMDPNRRGGEDSGAEEGRIVAWPWGRSSHSLGEREESWVGVKEIRSRVRSRKAERKRASSEIARNVGEAEEAAEEGPEIGAKRGGGPGWAMVVLRDAKPKRGAEIKVWRYHALIDKVLRNVGAGK